MAISTTSLDGKKILVQVRSTNIRALQNKIYDKAAEIAANCISRTHSRLFTKNYIEHLLNVCVEKADVNEELKSVESNTYWLEILINER